MAHLQSGNGVLLGGSSATPEAVAVAMAVPPSVPPPPTNRRYGPEEFVRGLECHYGSFAYRYSPLPNDNVSQTARHRGCHNPIERPEERHYCEACGGNYCNGHAAPKDHDCAYIVAPKE